jgi:hypothetical protein
MSQAPPPPPEAVREGLRLEPKTQVALDVGDSGANGGQPHIVDDNQVLRPDEPCHEIEVEEDAFEPMVTVDETSSPTLAARSVRRPAPFHDSCWKGSIARWRPPRSSAAWERKREEIPRAKPTSIVRSMFSLRARSLTAPPCCQSTL